MENASVKLNSGFIMRPYSMFHGDQGSRAQLTVAGQIFSLTQKENVCRWGYATLCEKLNMAKSTVAGAVRKICENGWFSRERRGGKTSEYTYVGATMERGHIRTENFFYTEEIVFDGEKRYLTLSEVDVLSLIYTHTRNPKTKKFEGSTKTIAGILGVSERTVRRAVKVLLEVELIFRPEKGVNKHVANVFAANMKWIRAMERVHKRAEKAENVQEQRPKEVVDADARSERAQFYAALQQEANAKAERYLALAKKNAQYVELQKALGKMELTLAKVELYDVAKLPETLARKAELIARRDVVLREMGLAQWMLKAKSYCKCKHCSDTGYLPNGVSCDCYTLRI